MVVIFITLSYMVVIMSAYVLTCIWCGDTYKDRVVFLISNRFVYTYYYVD